VRCTTHLIIVSCTLLSMAISARAQGVDVSARIVLQNERRSGAAESKKTSDASEVVMWLSPLQASGSSPASPAHPPYRLLQRDKQFTPHLLVVLTGSNVEFPNTDPFFHNVFSLYNGKRFDLGLYESGTSRSVRFDREGVSYIFCNIHPEMAAVVLALSTPYYGISQANGTVVIHGVPPGSYRLHVWSEHAKPPDQREVQRVLRVTGDALNLGEISMESTASPINNHKNKFGDEYKPESGSQY
jgi:plastocyanin